MRISYRRSVFVSLTVLSASSLAGLAGCASESAPEEHVGAGEDAVRRRVNPRNGNGALEIDGMGWDAAAASGAYSIAGDTVIAIGGRVERVPGSYRFEASGGSDFGVQPGLRTSDAVALQLGQVVVRKPAAVRVRYAEPISLGSALVTVKEVGVNSGTLTLDDAMSRPTATTVPWSQRALGYASVVVGGHTLEAQSSAGSVDASGDAGTRRLTIADGELKEFVLPTARVQLAVDSYDASYPTPTTCEQTKLFVVGTERGVAADNINSVFVRRADGTPESRTFVVPQGPNQFLTLQSYGVEGLRIATGAGRVTHTLTLNRLEVNDVEMVAVNGASTFVKGTYKVERKRLVGPAASVTWDVLNCRFPTHTGIDLADGTYRVTSTATTAQGTITHVEELSFP